MDKTIKSRWFHNQFEVEKFLNELYSNGWNMIGTFIQVVYQSTDEMFIVFYNKYLEEPMKRGVNL